MGLALAARQAQKLPLLWDIGYGDSYILFDVLRFQKTGTIYRDLAEPPYVAAQYSPAAYMLYSLPGRLFGNTDDSLGPRLVSLASFLACLAIVISLVRTLVPDRGSWLWGLLLACSIARLWPWVFQIRADFPGIFLSLLAIRLLISNHRRAVFLAALCAGLALQFKITFAAAGAAGTVWLAGRREWRQLGIFVAVAGVAALGPYLLYSMREPRMFAQMFALSPGISDVRGAIKLLYEAARNIVVVLALAGTLAIVSQRDRRWSLLLIYALVATVFGTATAVQAGANYNYFYEPLLALIPLSVLGAYALLALASRDSAAGFFVGVLLVVFVAIPNAIDSDLREHGPSIATQNAELRNIQRALRGKHSFSTVPRLALLDSAPALTEPYLLSYSLRLGKTTAAPLLARIQRQEFDAIITRPHGSLWRGLPFITPVLHSAISTAYHPYCQFDAALVFLPNGDRGTAAGDFAAVGCVPITAGTVLDW